MTSVRDASGAGVKVTKMLSHVFSGRAAHSSRSFYAISTTGTLEAATRSASSS